MNIQLFDNDWLEIKQAYILIQSTNLSRIDGGKWIIYRVGNIIRLDIK